MQHRAVRAQGPKIISRLAPDRRERRAGQYVDAVEATAVVVEQRPPGPTKYTSLALLPQTPRRSAGGLIGAGLIGGVVSVGSQAPARQRPAPRSPATKTSSALAAQTLYSVRIVGLLTSFQAEPS